MAEKSARLIALGVLNRYKPQNTNLSELLGSVLSKTSGISDHGFVRDLVWGVVRYLKALDFIIAGHSNRKKLDPEVRNILRLGLFQLIYCRDYVPEYAALSESVELARMVNKPAAAGFVNAVLRKAQGAQIETLLSDGDPDILNTIALKFSYPLWMVRRWFERYGARETVALCEAGNRQPNLTVRTNTARISSDELQIALEREGVRVEPCRYSPDGIRFVSSQGLGTLESFKKGLFCVQDEASQLVSYLLGVSPGDEVLDLCCGAGIKSFHLSLLAGGKSKITGVDSSGRRLEKARGNFKAYGVKNVKLIKADVLKLKAVKCRKVLLDAPCSGLGAIRRKPDIKWNRQETDITVRYPKLQAELLNAAACYVKPRGTIVYCTCTTEPEENERVVDRFLCENKNFALEKPELPLFGEELLSDDGRFFKTFTHRHGTDCFFGARITRLR